MITIWKYDIHPEARGAHFTLQMPEGSEILHVETQKGTPCMWVRLDPDAPDVEREFITIGTGHELPPGIPLDHIGTYQLHDGVFVGHLFERTAR